MTTPPAKPPPNDLPPKLWSFVKEIFFNRTAVAGFIWRHKFAAFHCLTNTILFVLGMLLLEFNFDAQNKLVKMTIAKQALQSEVSRIKPTLKAYDQCRSNLVTALAITCSSPNHRPTIPANHRRQHSPQTGSSIADKLNAIRDRST